MHRHEARHASYRQITEAIGCLVGKHVDVHPPGVVAAEVYRARERMLRDGVRSGLADATEAAADIRLQQIAAEAVGIEPEAPEVPPLVG